MRHEEYKDGIDADKEVDYLVDCAQCAREESAALVEEKMRFAKLSVGGATYFGRDTLEEGDLSGNLWWDVLAVESDRVLLVNRYVIDCRPYNETRIDFLDVPFDEDFFEEENFDQAAYDAWFEVREKFSHLSWATCDLHAWLNGEFLARAFNDSERSIILPTTVQTPGEYDSRDQVFCLSADEVVKYHEGLGWYNLCKPTERAERKGVEWFEDDGSAHEPTVVLDDRSKSASWWLRGAGARGEGDTDKGRAAYVDALGNVRSAGALVDCRNIGVRPAMWVAVERGGE